MRKNHASHESFSIDLTRDALEKARFQALQANERVVECLKELSGYEFPKRLLSCLVNNQNGDGLPVRASLAREYRFNLELSHRMELPSAQTDYAYDLLQKHRVQVAQEISLLREFAECHAAGKNMTITADEIETFITAEEDAGMRFGAAICAHS